jgi:ABC-type uncharacterized transport system substrate-binding protein
MKRRAFITLIGGAATWPLVARAQQREPRRLVGGLLSAQESDPATLGWLASFERRLNELGWTDDRNVRFERRWAAGDPERMRANAAEMVRLAPDVILAQNTPMVAVLRQQIDTIPIVFVQVSDPVGDGFVQALARPAGNVTGFTNTMSSLGGKWVEMLHEAAPGVTSVGYLFNRAAAPGRGAYYMEPLLSAAAALGLKVIPLELHNAGEIDSVIAGFVAAGGNGLIANSDAFITVNRARIIAAASRHRLPAIYSSAIFTGSGGLISYGADPGQQWQAAASYVDRILRGEKPRDLPVQLPAKFVLTINLKAAKAIGLDVPWFLQQRADEVIE